MSVPGPEEVRFIAEVCSIADKPFVEAVENNFAGHFNELGITVRLRPDATDDEVIDLQNDLLAYLTHEEKSPSFTWLVSFSRAGHNLRSLFPGDLPRNRGDSLEWAE